MIVIGLFAGKSGLVGNHFLHIFFLGLVDRGVFAKIPLGLSAFLGENMTSAGFLPFYFSGAGNFKALFRTTV